MGQADELQGGHSVTLVGHVVFGADRWVGPWVAQQIPGYVYDGAPTLGVWKERLVAGVTYDRFNGQHCEVAIAAEPGAAWADRQTLRTLFAYPFLQLGAEALTVLVPSTNLPSLNLATKLGFEVEAIIRLAAHDGSDLVVLKMYRQQCRWIHGQQQGRERAESA